MEFVWFRSIGRQAFWLADHSTDRPFPGSLRPQWDCAAFVPAYSNGWLAMDLHHLSYYRHGVTHLLTTSPGELEARAALIDQFLCRCQLKKHCRKGHQIEDGLRF